jgi:hypothetical protein
MHVSGELRTVDGAHLDIDATLYGTSLSNDAVYGMSFTVRRGGFATEIEAGELSLSGWARGFAPFCQVLLIFSEAAGHSRSRPCRRDREWF